MFNGEVHISILSESDRGADEENPPATKIPQQEKKRNCLIEYDESEGVSDVSFASDSCTSMRSRAARGSFRITSPIHFVCRISCISEHFLSNSRGL